jgi:uncharacterized protein (TIGR02646 family)
VSFRFDKSKEPAELRVWIRKSEPLSGRIWEELPTAVKDAIRARLHRDQRGLCCYCYARVTDDHISHVEHVAPQNSDNRFDWDNLALACDGGNQGKNPAHCDHAKGQTSLDTVHPYKAPLSRFVTLRDKGRLSVVEAARRDVEQVLNLNARHLQRQRESVREALIAMLQRRKRPDESWRPQDIAQALNMLRSRGEPIDYQPLIEDWLERRLRRDS